LSDGGGDGAFYSAMVMAVVLMSAASFGLFLLKETVAGEVEANLVYDAKYEAKVMERIRPVAKLSMPTSAEAAAAASVVPIPEPVIEKLSGGQVYNVACFACHAGGIGGAPTLGDADAWGVRLAQGRDVMNQHVLEGYTGPSGGYMPPKGGRIDLSDEEVLGGLDYMLEQLP
jgi:cytochrome c5